MKKWIGLIIVQALVRVLDAAEISTEADLRAAMLQGTGSHELMADLTLSADLPALPAGSAFSLGGRNHFISGDGKYSLFKCPNHGTVLALENLTLKKGYTDQHGAAVSSGQGTVVQRDIPGSGLVPIMIEGSRTNRVVIRNCVLKDNVSTKSGGAIFVHLEGEPGQPYLLIENSAIVDNTVLEGPGIPTFKVNAENNNGGGIWVRVQAYQSDVIIRNTTISGNHAPELAGGILIGESAGPTNQAMAVKLFHCTVANNDCGSAGGAFWHDHSLLLDHSIVFGNSVKKNRSANGANFAGPGPSLTIRWSAIGFRGDENGVPIEQRCQSPVKGYASIWEGNNLGADPELSPFPIFVAARGAQGTAYDTYVHVFEPSSPVYNAGDPGLDPGPAFSWDQRGEPKKRVASGRIDLGSYEFDFSTANSPPTLSAIDPVHILEDQAARITFAVSDKETAPESLLVALDSNPQGRIVLDGIDVDGGKRTLTLRPDRDYNTAVDGPRTLTVIVQDAIGASAKQSFTLEIDPVNDRPSLRGPMDTLFAGPGLAITHDFGFPSRLDRGDDTTAGLEKDQTVGFHLLDVSRNDFFQALTINPGDGKVIFTTRADLTGKDTARVRFYLKDGGGIRNGGFDSSEAYSFIVVIKGVVALPEAMVLQAHMPGLVSHSRIVSPFPLTNSLILVDSSNPGACLNCSSPRAGEAMGQLSAGGTIPGFHPFLISLKTNVPLRYNLKFFTAQGEFVNKAEGEITEAILDGLKKDGEGNRTVKLYWWPVSSSGIQAATGAYVARGSISAARNTAPRNGSPANPPTLARRVSSLFGYLRR